MTGAAVGAGAGASAAMAAAAIAQAIKASGTIVQLEPDVWLALVDNAEAPMVIRSVRRGMFSTTHKYLTSYKGLAFYAKSDVELPISGHCEVIEAKKIWMPG